MVSGIFDVRCVSGVIHGVFGQLSVIVILLIASGPLFVTAIVNFASSPGKYIVLSDVFVVIAFAFGAYA
jgi:hypothetical protein